MERHRDFRWIRVCLAGMMGSAGMVGCGQIVGIEEPRDTRPHGGAGGDQESGGHGTGLTSGDGGSTTSGSAGSTGMGSSGMGGEGMGGVGQGGAGAGTCAKVCNDGAWLHRGHGDGDARAESAAFDTAGNLVVAGNFAGTMVLADETISTFSKTDIDGFVTKFAGKGNIDWIQPIGDANNATYDVRLAAAVDGSVAVVGNSGRITRPPGFPQESTKGDSDIFVANFDANGTLKWATMVGSDNGEYVGGVAIDAHGNVIVTGYFWGAMTCDGASLGSVASYDVFVAKWNADGKLQWAKPFGGLGNQNANAIAVDPSGNILIAGRFSGPFSTGVVLNHIGNDDVFVIQLDENGTPLHAMAWGTAAGYENAFALASDGSNVYVGGSASGASGTAALVLRFDASLNTLSTKAWGQTKYQAVQSLMVAGDGSVLIAGTFQEPLDIGCGLLTTDGMARSIFLGGFSPELDCIWQQPYNAEPHTDSICAIAARGTCDIALAGSMTVQTPFDCPSESNPPTGEDAFVFKLPIPLP